MQSLKRLEIIVKQLEPLLKKEEDELKDMLGEEYEDDEKNQLSKRVEAYETALAKALKDELKRVKSYAKSHVSKNVINITALAAYVVSQMEESPDLETAIVAITEAELSATMVGLVAYHMDVIDKDVAFNQLSKRTTNWIKSWSSELGSIMKLSTVDSVERILLVGLEEGQGIDEISRRLEESEGFSRARARRTAITEILTANTASQLEAYAQSPAVVGKRWKHSGSKGIDPRPHHVKYSGSVVAVDKPFTVGKHKCMFPRDPKLPASERVNCHCAMGPVTDESIMSKTQKQKRKLHEKAMKELNKG